MQKKPEFRFEMLNKAVEYNFCELAKYGKYLGRALEAQKASLQGYGLEFRDVQQLEKIFHCHPNWERLNRMLLKGSEWLLKE
eukprot:2628959-Ditylum_brightwellii.AAC.1